MRLKLFQYSIFALLSAFVILGFYFNLEFTSKNIDLNFIGSQPKENGMVRKLVYISGEVNNPGVYEFNNDMRVIEVIELAGGFSENADSNFITEKLNLAERLKDEQQIFIPAVGTLSSAESIQVESTSSNYVNINTASLEELDALPGIGPSTAQKIIENRPYTAKEELLNISGIGESKFNEISELIGI